MKFIVFYIKTLLGNNPTISGKTEKILVEISDAVGITFVYLAKAFIFNRLSNCFAIYL